MSKIVHSDVAPDDAEVFSLGQGPTVKITKSGSYETSDPVEIANAMAHPWLDVVQAKEDYDGGTWWPTLAPEDDVLSAVNSKANDPKEVKKARDEFHARFAVPAAVIDAGLPQDKKIKDDAGNSKTLAADAAATAKANAKDKE
jgi:hypothetical protein